MVVGAGGRLGGGEGPGGGGGCGRRGGLAGVVAGGRLGGAGREVGGSVSRAGKPAPGGAWGPATAGRDAHWECGEGGASRPRRLWRPRSRGGRPRSFGERGGGRGGGRGAGRGGRRCGGEAGGGARYIIRIATKSRLSGEIVRQLCRRRGLRRVGNGLGRG